jgi:hypothetical protein
MADQNNGFNTHIWGPSLWHVLHTISFNYPLDPSARDKAHYYKFVRSVGRVLPCRACRKNYKANLKAAGFGEAVLRSRAAFSKFVYDLHTAVTVAIATKPTTTKPTATPTTTKPTTTPTTTPTFHEVRRTYEAFRATDCTENTALGHGGCGGRAKGVVHIMSRENKSCTFVVDPNCLGSDGVKAGVSRRRKRRRRKRGSKK